MKRILIVLISALPSFLQEARAVKRNIEIRIFFKDIIRIDFGDLTNVKIFLCISNLLFKFFSWLYYFLLNKGQL